MSHRFKSFAHLLTLCLFCITCSMPVVFADTLTIPNTFTAGTPAQAAQVNANFNAVGTVVNGNLDNNNIKSGAAIAASKIDFSTGINPTGEVFVKRAATNRCLSAGVSGDTIPRVTLTSDGYLQLGPGSSSAVDLQGRRKDANTFQLSNVALTANKTFEGDGFAATTFGDANPKAQLSTTGLTLGAGGASAVDVSLLRASAGVLEVRNANDSADAALTLSNLTASGTLNVTGATTLDGTLTGNAIVQGLRPGGRLTLTSNTPVTGDVTGAGTIYYTPYLNNLYPAYTTASGKYTAKTFTEASLTLTISSGTNYDVFGVYTSGTTPVLSTLAWTNDTTRATALARSTISGLLYKTGDEQSLYLGTIRGSGSNVTAKSRAAGQLYVWNMYNRVVEDAIAQDPTDSWTYTLAAYQEQRAQATEGVSRIGIVRGIDEDSIDAFYSASMNNSSAGATAQGSVGIGIDNATNVSQNQLACIAAANCVVPLTATYRGKPGIGYRTIRALEQAAAVGTCTHYGDNGGTAFQTGMRLSQPM